MTPFIDLRQTKEYAQFMLSLNWQVEDAGDCQILIKKIPIIGSFIKVQRPRQIELKQLLEIAKNYRAFFISVEPDNDEQTEALAKNGFKQKGSPYLCSKTIRLDLTKSEDKILAEMKKDNRYEINKGLKGNVLQLNEEQNLIEFHDVWKKSVHLKRWVPPINYLEKLKDSFGKNIIFLTASRDQQIYGGICLIFTKNVAYYYYAFSNSEGKRHGAPYFLVWQGILESKKRGCKIFDFEGIYDERFKTTNSWKGFTHFKKGFGGKEITYPPPYQKLIIF